MARERISLTITGVVQGVGFRPFVYNLARRNGLAGFVLNTGEGVIIEAEGELKDLERFRHGLKKEAPPRARIESVNPRIMHCQGDQEFVIKPSVETPGSFQLVSPDIATCEDCVSDFTDPADRRFRYPFTNCTNCGPRFTIIEDMPYDRPKTTMKKFEMCPDCQAEYDDPGNRRFHAQPNACPVCGPKLSFVGGTPHPALSPSGRGIIDGVEGDRQANNSALSPSGRGIIDGVEGDRQANNPALSPSGRGIEGEGEQGAGSSGRESEEALAAAVAMLKSGKVVAIKSLGGFQLACDAENENAVKRLREKKHRYGKPLAVMAASIEEAAEFCEISDAEREQLESPERPIVLLRSKPKPILADSVAPGNKYVGVMLPYTPLHYLLLNDSGLNLVMTSGNLSEEPIAAENEEGLRRLEHIADGFLLHDRDIYSRYDDPVVRVVEGNRVMIRRARGYAPYPVHLPFTAKTEVLAVGGELKSTFCLVKEGYAFVSQHIGDMENVETLEHFERTLELYKKLFRVNPEIIACDMHPEYFSSKYARGLNAQKLVEVQHHHAHIAAVTAENDFRHKVIGVAFDGTGYGPDGTIWGGEFLIADWAGFKRAAHLKPVRLPGGEASVEKPYRTAFSYLYSVYGGAYKDLNLDFIKRVDPIETGILVKQVETGLLSPLTSSAGRFFDAVSSMIGIRDEIEFEGQAAIELEMASDEANHGRYDYKYLDAPDQPSVIDTDPVIKGIVNDLLNNIPAAVIGAKFHETVAVMIIDTCLRLKDTYDINTVALSGGVFQNAALYARVIKGLKVKGFRLLLHKELPVNDGGISLGQAVIAYTQSL